MCRAQSGVSSLCTWRPWARVQRPGHQQYRRRDGDARCLGNGGSGDAVEIADSLRTTDTSNRTTVKYMCAHVCGRGRQAGGVAWGAEGGWYWARTFGSLCPSRARGSPSKQPRTCAPSRGTRGVEEQCSSTAVATRRHNHALRSQCNKSLHGRVLCVHEHLIDQRSSGNDPGHDLQAGQAFREHLVDSLHHCRHCLLRFEVIESDQMLQAGGI